MTIIELPPGPRCKKCGHMPCPCCGIWCDILECEQCGLDSDNIECEYDEDEIKAWNELIKPQLDEAYEKGLAVTVKDSP